MKQLAASVIAFILVGCASVSPGILAPQVIADASLAVVAIEFQPEGTERGKTHCSGTVIEAGVILTNAHCLSANDNRRYVVRFKDGTRATAFLLRKAENYDAALLSVDPRATKHVARVALEGVADGDVVFAVGHPMGLRWTVTTGIVSNANRTFEDDEASPDVAGRRWVQTDAPINPGNSGGALFNVRGELVGVPTMKFVHVAAENLGFALPIADVLAKLGVTLNGA